MTVRPRLCLVGPMLGSVPGWVVSQGEILADLFSREGFEVMLTSRRPRRLPRLMDTVATLTRGRHEYDVAIVAVFSGPGFQMANISSLLLRRLRKPIVLYLRGGNLPAFAARHPRQVSRVLRRADVVIAPSDYLADELGAFVDRIEVIPNVIDLARYSFVPRDDVRPDLLWMRTFHEVYEPAVAIEAFRLIVERRPEATLTMAGQDKGLLEPTRGLASRYRLSDRIQFPGFLSETKKKVAFRDHDIFLNTPRVDNVPVSVLEVCASGMPVVATEVGGISRLLNHETEALLVRPSDPYATAEAVVRLLEEPGLANRLSHAGRKVAERFSWARVFPAWEELLARLC